ncbi:MAG: rhodanese-like domain-containing protein [Clostridium chrysemydis]|uniref:rhodanese-like domain-containing protein n=1 Tax=Clostridium chrysemydis TaxID=2665504 RepID=UPI003F346F79
MLKKTKYLTLILTISILGIFLVSCTSKDDSKSPEAQTKTITTSEVKENLGKDNWVVVDTRSNDAFNGWKLDSVSRSGHIKGATDFSALWLDVSDKDKDEKLDKTLKDKGITPDKNIVLYDANSKDSKKIADYLSKKGYKNIYTYDVKEWANDKSLPMESFENYQLLVPPSFVNDLIEGKKPETFNNDNFKIFEVSWGDLDHAKDYKDGHIKGAVHINTDEIESAPLWSLNSDKDLIKFAKNNGITKNDTVVLYGADPMASYRLAAILTYLGVKDVRVLNGGTAAWTNAGLPMETTVNPKKPVDSFGSDKPLKKDYIIDINKAKEILNGKDSKLVDIRSYDEYIGKTSGYPDLSEKGRPKGSTWGKAGSDAHHLEDYRNIDNTMRNGDEILAMWKSLGIDPNEKLAFFCGSGWRAAEVTTYANVLGLKDIALYSNGWYEWSSDKSNPTETGEPTK